MFADAATQDSWANTTKQTEELSSLSFSSESNMKSRTRDAVKQVVLFTPEEFAQVVAVVTRLEPP